MAIKKVPASWFAKFLETQLQEKAGYIMGSYGQDPKKWSVNSWWFTQYSGSQKEKALYWREHAKRVFDCQGLAEGAVLDYTGVNVNTKARYNYAQWCGIKGTGMIPAKYRVPGAAVFTGSKAASIPHVMFLYKPVEEGNPAGDWYLIEARGVAYGVVKTKLLSRKPTFWGLMTKYFDYENAEAPTEVLLGDRLLRDDCEGDDVKQLQTNLIRLGYDCGKWGADGDFGDATELAVMAFQRDHGLEVDGEYGPKSHAAMEKAMAELDKPEENPKKVTITGGQCWIRTEPDTTGKKLGIAREGAVYTFAGETAENGWLQIETDGQKAWVSGKYGKLTA